MTGADLRARREALGWTLEQAADACRSLMPYITATHVADAIESAIVAIELRAAMAREVTP